MMTDSMTDNYEGDSPCPMCGNSGALNAELARLRLALEEVRIYSGSNSLDDYVYEVATKALEEAKLND